MAEDAGEPLVGAGIADGHDPLRTPAARWAVQGCLQDVFPGGQCQVRRLAWRDPVQRGGHLAAFASEGIGAGKGQWCVARRHVRRGRIGLADARHQPPSAAKFPPPNPEG